MQIFGDQIHIAKVNDKYVLMIEANTITFEKVVERVSRKQQYVYDARKTE
ncbi:DUF3898 domain-containing protein [Bacillus toyonensis]|nr:DUF3898 domain-containing protein [Bacillus toyonensis]MCU5726674.1 DUF3898 domain-containing protein [Bacillus toyonensis]